MFNPLVRFLSRIAPLLLLPLFPFFLTAMDQPFISTVPVNPTLVQDHPLPTSTMPTQADLDRLQFAKEQETKILVAAVNKKPKSQTEKIEHGLKELLKDQRIQEECFDCSLIEKIPAAVQKEIVKCVYSPTGFSQGYELLPALIPRYNLCLGPGENPANILSAKKYVITFFVRVSETGREQTFFNRLANLREYMSFMEGYVSSKRRNGISGPDHFGQGSSFTASRKIVPKQFDGIIDDGTLYVRDRSTSDLLDSCSLAQL